MKASASGQTKPTAIKARSGPMKMSGAPLTPPTPPLATGKGSVARVPADQYVFALTQRRGGGAGHRGGQLKRADPHPTQCVSTEENDVLDQGPIGVFGLPFGDVDA